MFSFRPEQYWQNNPWAGTLNGVTYFEDLPRLTLAVDLIMELLDQITIAKLNGERFEYYNGTVYEDSQLPKNIIRLGIFSFLTTKTIVIYTNPNYTKLQTTIATTRQFEAHARGRSHQELRDMIMELLVTNGRLG